MRHTFIPGFRVILSAKNRQPKILKDAKETFFLLGFLITKIG